jgi:adenylate kinase
MIFIFGPAGSGKSVQGQFLAARYGWKWLSMGQLLRDADDPRLSKIMGAGELVPFEVPYQILDKAYKKIHKKYPQIVVDGFPRDEAQAIMAYEDDQWNVDLAIVLDVPREEVLKRMMLRKRADDTDEGIKERLAIYKRNMADIKKVLSKNGTKIVEVDGVGGYGQVHDRVAKVLEQCKLA